MLSWNRRRSSLSVNYILNEIIKMSVVFCLDQCSFFVSKFFIQDSLTAATLLLHYILWNNYKVGYILDIGRIPVYSNVKLVWQIQFYLFLQWNNSERRAIGPTVDIPSPSCESSRQVVFATTDEEMRKQVGHVAALARGHGFVALGLSEAQRHDLRAAQHHEANETDR